jgi:hypothetical protein
MSKAQCPICQTGADETERPGGRDSHFFKCPNCGGFEIAGTALSTLPKHVKDPVDAACLSHWVRRGQSLKEPVFIGSETAEKILKAWSLPNPSEQADLLVLWLGDEIKAPGRAARISRKNDRARLGCVNPEGVEFILNALKDEGLISLGRGYEGQEGSIEVALTFGGWRRFEELKRGPATLSRRAFMAMQFGNLDLDRALEECFRVAAKKAGFELIRLDQNPQAGLIDNRILAEIRTSAFVLADLTNNNAGAYWEAGLAEGLGKPVIYSCEAGFFNERRTHFDTNHRYTVLWKLDELPKAAGNLKATIRATLPGQARMTDEEDEPVK